MTSGGLPATLGKYQIIREIARSNDIVYEGYDPQMNRRVAIKELALTPSATAQQKEDRAKRFQREVKAAGSLSHPGIVTIYEYGEDQGRVYMAMEFLDGHTLRNELDTRGFLPSERAIEIAIEVLDALEFAHKNGVIHRDIKPENIQVLSSGRIKLTDFGIARLVFEPNLTMDGQVFGTPSYMSPEQVVGKELDARSDVFSIGAVLYEMLSGQKAFGGDNVMAISYAIMNKSPDELPQIGYELWQVILQALDKTVQMRFASASAFADALRRARDNQRQGIVAPSGPAMPQMPTMMPQAPIPQVPMPPAPPYQYGTVPTQHGGVPPYPMGTQQQQPMNYVPIPVYYAPPPRPPLLKPETKRALANFTYITVGIALLLGVVYWAVVNIGKAATSLNAKDLPSAVRPLERSGTTAPNAPSTESAEARAARAQLLSVEAQEAMRQAQTETQPDTQARLWMVAGEKWAELSDYQTGEKRLATRQNAAIALYNAAVKLEEIGERPNARRVLYEARNLAEPGSEAEQAILTQLQRMGG